MLAAVRQFLFDATLSDALEAVLSSGRKENGALIGSVCARAACALVLQSCITWWSCLQDADDKTFVCFAVPLGMCLMRLGVLVVLRGKSG